MIEMVKNAVHMFFFLATELIVLFIGLSYLVGILQEYIPPEKIQRILASKKGKGFIIAAFLGAITPFCSCSTIPFLKGLLRARAGFGPMMVFLFSSPLLNPIIIVLFFVTLGGKVALFYFIMALGVSVIAGYTLEKLGFDKHIKPEAYEVQKSSCASSCSAKKEPVNKWQRIWNTTWDDFKSVFPYLLVGVTLGSVIYGFVPTDFVARYAGKDNLFAIPIAAVIGIPLYIRAEAVIPLSAALVSKGMGLGAVMALIIGSAGASLTEVILLKSIFKNKMIAAFLFVVLTMAVASGYLYNFIF
ncbi:MAG: permease [Endozoicomonas sp. (ex Botrylloides leachii)]|nr:permease [Endozoicomonas sp. (ex Botrylloides leachii)]